MNDTKRGLLPQPTGKARGQFTRCGLLSIIARNVEARDKMERAGQLDRSCVRYHDWLEYEEYDGNGYTIFII